MDILTPENRSKRMRLVRSKGTKPEKIVKSLIHQLGHKYRSHSKSLPGSPDLVFPRLKKVIYVHGCFWHRHSACRQDHRPRSPKSRLDYWQAKLARNRVRDKENQRSLNRMAWNYMIVWECALRNKGKLAKLSTRIVKFLRKPRLTSSSRRKR